MSNGDEGEYRPSVPPHRNTGITANTNSNTNENIERQTQEGTPVQKRRHHKHHRSTYNQQDRRSQVNGSVDLICSYDRPPDQHLNFYSATIR